LRTEWDGFGDFIHNAHRLRDLRSADPGQLESEASIRLARCRLRRAVRSAIGLSLDCGGGHAHRLFVVVVIDQ
jgi:hypothetical protein